MTDDLVTFINARLQEDEAIARASTPGPWRAVKPEMSSTHSNVHGPGPAPWADYWDGPEEPGDYEPVAYGGRPYAACGDDDAAHIARHDPARVLREVEAKRQILDDVDGLNGQWYDEIEGRVMVSLALPYSDHPDYREEWRPNG